MNPLHIEVWIASHLSTESRGKYLRYALKSINEQTRLPNYVRVSISGNKRLGPSDKEICDILSNIPAVDVARPKKRQMQFEHLKNIWIWSRGNASLTPDAWIVFCDDDDLCAPARIEDFVANVNKRYLMYGSGTIAFEGDCDSFDKIETLFNRMVDFGSLICSKRLLDRYFTEDHDVFIRKYKGRTDVYFRIVWGA